MMSSEPLDKFEYDSEAQAVIVREADTLTHAFFPEHGWKRIRNRPPGAVGGDWLVWCIYDEEYDRALVVRAELRSHYEERREQ